MTRPSWDRRLVPDAQAFTERYAAALGVEALSETDVEAVLDLAGTAAHASERTAAPLSCWLAAKAGLTPAGALALAQDVAESFRDTLPFRRRHL